MRMLGWNNNRIAFVKFVIYVVYCDLSDTIKTGYECISARFMGADLFTSLESEQCNTEGRILCKSLADDWPFLIGYLIFQFQNFCFFNVFH